MFPISDVIPSRTRPAVTIGLIAVNALLFLYQLQLDDVSLQRLVFAYGVIPARFSSADVVTSMFLHADFLHFLGNMVFLWIFGDNVEDRPVTPRTCSSTWAADTSPRWPRSSPIRSRLPP
jgi:membrane associated rhomboid family serine protease